MLTYRYALDWLVDWFTELLRCVHYAASELTPSLCYDLAAHLSPEIEAAFYLLTNLGLLARDLMDIGLRDLVLQRESAKIKVKSFIYYLMDIGLRNLTLLREAAKKKVNSFIYYRVVIALRNLTLQREAAKNKVNSFIYYRVVIGTDSTGISALMGFVTLLDPNFFFYARKIIPVTFSK